VGKSTDLEVPQVPLSTSPPFQTLPLCALLLIARTAALPLPFRNTAHSFASQLTTRRCTPTGNRLPLRNPIASYRTPPTEGPTNAPREKKDAHSPATIPYVVMSSGKPLDLQETRHSSDRHETDMTSTLWPGCTPTVLTEVGQKGEPFCFDVTSTLSLR
jgi:hypothetical protein